MLANCIGNYIEKHFSDKCKMSLPESILKIHEIHEVSIDAEKLENINNLWTFKGTAQVSYMDSGVKTTKEENIVGNAKVKFYPNAVNSKEMLPEVNYVTITMIKK